MLNKLFGKLKFPWTFIGPLYRFTLGTAIKYSFEFLSLIKFGKVLGKMMVII